MGEETGGGETNYKYDGSSRYEPELPLEDGEKEKDNSEENIFEDISRSFLGENSVFSPKETRPSPLIDDSPKSRRMSSQELISPLSLSELPAHLSRDFPKMQNPNCHRNSTLVPLQLQVEPEVGSSANQQTVERVSQNVIAVLQTSQSSESQAKYQKFPSWQCSKRSMEEAGEVAVGSCERSGERRIALEEESRVSYKRPKGEHFQDPFEINLSKLVWGRHNTEMSMEERRRFLAQRPGWCPSMAHVITYSNSRTTDRHHTQNNSNNDS